MVEPDVISNQEPQTVEAVCGILGRLKIARRVGKSPGAVSNAIKDGEFPASWYAVIKAMGDEVGISIPLTLFHFADDQGAPETTGTEG